MASPRERFNAIKPGPTYNPGELHRFFQDIQRGIPHAQGVDIRDFNALSARSAIQRAVTATAGGTVYIPEGDHLTDAIIVRVDGTRIRTDGVGTRLLASDNGMSILKIAASNCVVCDLTLSTNSHTSVEGLVLAPANESDHSTRVDQNFNRFGYIVVDGCLEAVRMRCGPGAVSGDSGCWYNTFLGIHLVRCTRGLWLQVPVTNAGGGATVGSQVNRNGFFHVRIGQSTNTGVQIDSGGTNNFWDLATEGVASGTSPNAIPTGLKIVASCAVTGGSNDSNRFFGYTVEANTRDIENDNYLTEFYGMAGVDSTRCAGSYPFGGINVTATPSATPLLLPGMQYGEGVTGYPSGLWGFTKPITSSRVGQSSGTSGVIANNATFVITLPTRVPVELMLISTTNPQLFRKYIVSGDGAAVLAATSLLDTTADTLQISATTATSVTVKNATGFSCNIGWGALVTAVAV